MTNFFNPDINSMNPGTKLESAGRIYRIQHQSRIKYWLMGILLLTLLIMFFTMDTKHLGQKELLLPSAGNKAPATEQHHCRYSHQMVCERR